MKLKLLLYLFIVYLFTPCLAQNYEITQKGVIIDLKSKNTRKVFIEPIRDDIIHVKATKEKYFSNDTSLVVLPQKRNANFKVEDQVKEIIVKTSKLSIVISKKTGEVSFKDSLKNLIIKEAKDGRTFTPINQDGYKAYSIYEVFESNFNDEALYGLGQHQADEFNYKKRSEELFQYNTKVSIPFIVSTKNYGIMWDSYSFLRFGEKNEYMQLDKIFSLYDKDEKKGGLLGTYTSKDKNNELIRREKFIFSEFLDEASHFENVINLPKDFNFSGSSVTYEGYIKPKESGEFRFLLYYAGYIKVYINNSLVVPERWRAAWNPNYYKFSVFLEKNKKVPLRIEWMPDGSISYIGLRALPPLSQNSYNQISWWSEMQKEEDYYFIYGNNMDEVIGGYRFLTGKAPIMPKWAFGFWQSRERYKTQDEILSTLKEFRLRNIPIDNIVQDWSYWKEDSWGSHEFDKQRFPEPKAMVDSIHKMNAHVMISIWPKFYQSTEHFKEFDSYGWMYRQAINDSILDWIGPGYLGSFYDAYSQGARKLFWSQIQEHLYPLGFDAWWMDASEPNIKDCTSMDYRKRLAGPTALGPSTQYFNAYALMNAKAIYEGQRSIDDKRRVFQLTRSGFLGLQRYSTATWSGDIASRWEDMKAQISAGLNFSVSGIPYWTMDIGGFSVENRFSSAQKEYNKTGKETEDLNEWRELNTRWYQFGAFCPLYRAHGQFPYREIWNLAPIGHPCYNSILYYTNLRYQLLPYIYSLAFMTYLNDYTIMRPLAMDFSLDENVYNISDQFLFGPSLMIAPVYEYKLRERKVYFPRGKGWYDFYTGNFISSNEELTVACPYERIPIYVPEGAIIPMGPIMQYVDEKPANLITLYVYGGKDGNFTLYEDTGETYNYEKGEFSQINFSYDDEQNTLSIGPTIGKYPNMINNRTFRIIKISPENPIAIDSNEEGKIVNYDGQEIKIEL